MREALKELPTLLICLVLFAISLWMIAEGRAAGWAGAILFGAGGAYLMREAIQRSLRSRSTRLWRERRNAELEGLIAEAAPFDFEDAVDFWKDLFARTEATWVVFENGTLVLCDEGPDPAASALEAIEIFSETLPGSALGDFTVTLRPDKGAWLVSYPGGRVFNYVEAEGCPSETAAGVLARSLREEDARTKTILHIGRPRRT